MSRKRNQPWRRTVVAYDVLRGRPPRMDYGRLVVLMVVASAGGALIGVALDLAVTRRSAPDGPHPVGGGHLSAVDLELREA